MIKIGSKSESINILETILIKGSLLNSNNNLFDPSIRREEPAASIVAEMFKLQT